VHLVRNNVLLQVAPYAGEVFDLGIKAIDELGNPTTASFRLTDGGTINSSNSKVFIWHCTCMYYALGVDYDVLCA
jgi:hypothetical protein